MNKLQLYQETSKGSYLTLSGAGILIDLIHQAIIKVGANPNSVVIRIKDGSLGAVIDFMFPTPHTFLFDSVYIHEGEVRFYLGGGPAHTANERKMAISLANPKIVEELAETILKRAKKHRATKAAINV